MRMITTRELCTLGWVGKTALKSHSFCNLSLSLSKMSQILFCWLRLLLLGLRLLLELILIEELLLPRLLLELSLKLLLARLLLELLLLDWLSSSWVKVWPLVVGDWLRLSELWSLLLELLLLLGELSWVESVEVSS